MGKKLYRCTTDKMLSGVCSGIAKYFGIDVTIVRLIWVLVSLGSASFPGLLIYIICAIVIPEEPSSFDTTGYYHEEN